LTLYNLHDRKLCQWGKLGAGLIASKRAKLRSYDEQAYISVSLLNFPEPYWVAC